MINTLQVVENIDKYELGNLKKTKRELQTIIFDSKKLADAIFENMINKKEVIDIFKNAHLQNENQKVILRQNLHSLLSSDYSSLTKYGIQQLHFHLPNNDSFLRFHKPGKFGDNLTQVSASVRYVNEHKKPTTGFEEGRIFNGYRFVYPLFDELNQHIGSVEISSSLLTFKESYERHSDNHIDYILKKDVVSNKVFDDQLKNYAPYILSNEFVIQKTMSDYNKRDIHKDERDFMLKSISENTDLMKKINQIEEFDSFIIKDFQLYKAYFIPLLNDFTAAKVGYMVVFGKSDYFKYILNSYLINFTVILFLSWLVGYIFYRKEVERANNHKQSLDYKAILDTYENMVIVASNCKIINMNNKFIAFYKPNSATNQPINLATIIQCGEHYICNDETLSNKLITNANKAIEVSITSTDNINKTFELFIHKTHSGDENKYILELKDITEHKEITSNLEDMALHDQLTGLYNRHYFENEFKLQFSEMLQNGTELSLIMFDIDHFKLINDQYGHNIGDESLIYLSRLVERHIREYDVFGRWGGEEFMILTKNSLQNTIRMAEKLRASIDADTKNMEKIPHFTCSFGVISVNEAESEKAAIEKVDSLLYESKENGRNRVSHMS